MIESDLNDSDRYILDAIQVLVWSGFYSADEVHSMIDDILEVDAHEEFLRAAVAPEFAKKKGDESSWPDETDCDRLDMAFARLDQECRILCLHNAGYTMSDGHEDAVGEIRARAGQSYRGYCFYHGQDLERAVRNQGLLLAFDHVDGDIPDKLNIGISVKEEMERVGLRVEWDRTPGNRIKLPDIVWRRRFSGSL